MKKILAHGTFDIIHYGHLNYLENAKSLGDYLIVFVTSDNLARKNGKNPYFNEYIRMRMVKAFRVVDEVILRDTEITADMIRDLNIDTFVTVSDSFDYLNGLCNIKKFKRTEEISSTKIKDHLTINRD